MKLYELSKIPFQERFHLVSNINSNNNEFNTTNDDRIVLEIFNKTIKWFAEKTPETMHMQDLNLRTKLENGYAELPSMFETIYEIMEKSLIKELPDQDKQRIFEESKILWRLDYPEFNEICNTISKFGNDRLLVEFQHSSPPSFIRYPAADIYKKCLSYKVKLNQNKIDLLGYSYKPSNYCINKEIVINFTDEYAVWGREASRIWNKIYVLKVDFNSFYSYQDWNWYIKSPGSIRVKRNEIDELLSDTISLLNEGLELVKKWDKCITSEYETCSTEMSLYERELEISLLHEAPNSNDNEYCYVYTLECDLFIFYVGIAANPFERLGQHLRGAFSNEHHLFKSKLIQKYHNEIKQKIIFEGTRRQCKDFEKDYISRFNPLGNMTTGGEG